MLYDRTRPPSLPSDLAGITAATFAPHASGNLAAALGAPSTTIRNAIEKRGTRNDKKIKILENATQEQRPNSLDIFRTAFPDDLIRRRAVAMNLLLIGLTMTRTVQAGSLVDMRRILQSGGHIRILIVDPTNDELVAAISRNARPGVSPDRVRRRIQETLYELTDLQDSTNGNLEVRVASFIPPMGLNVIDADTENGLIVAQHYEHRAVAEASPIISLKPANGTWYQHFAAEALRLWESGTPWPLSAIQKLARLPRPRFRDAFGPELQTSMDDARDLLITGITRNTLIMSNYNKFEEWLQRGCRIRVVMLDPSSDAVATAADRYYAGRSPDVVRERINHTLRLLAELKRSTAGSISVRLTAYPIAMGVIAVDSITAARSDVSALFIEYYTYQARGEPKFVLQPSDGTWFENFLGEAEAIWENAIERTFADSSPTSVESVTILPTGHLKRPLDSRVDRKYLVAGVVSNLPPNSEALIIVQTPKDRLYWPQARLRLNPEGKFICEATFGRVGTRDSGKEFILMLVVISSSAAATSFQSSIKDDNSVSSLPPDVLVLDKVTVTRS
jgi:hypothetical protein